MTENAETVYIRYRNHRGVTSWRRIIPVEIGYYATAWHGEPHWILQAMDLDKDAERDFAMKDILEWRTTPPESITPQAFAVGQRVRKIGGDYTIDGVIAAVVLKRSGAVRYVVEDDAPRDELHIYSASNLEAI